MSIPILSRIWDERFASHRRRSTSLAGLIGGFVAIGLFAYHYYADGIWSWDLMAIVLTMIVVKWAVLVWYLITD
ncbi:MAG: hypothetical protein ACJ8AJ_04325 [Gemmatimonadaceae bacterium]